MDSHLAISALLTEQTITLQLHSQQREALFAELIDRIPGISRRPEAKRSLLAAVREREAMHTTALGDGVAIPHARNAIDGVTDHAVVVFGRHDQGIAYGASDGRPVQLFFLLIAPTIAEHLQILARLSRLLREPGFADLLRRASSASEVIRFVQQAEQRLMKA
jgi:mannitol/fructose-specific phosphotransferase system IIA component (Ntr-type)